jgi:hypothetical protein
MAAKKSRKLLEKVSEGGFDFHVYADATEVYVRGKRLGTILGMKELSGRHCFRLGSDSRSHPRTYRGRVRAAQALHVIEQLKRDAKKQRWSADEMIIRAWDSKPHASPRQAH